MKLRRSIAVFATLGVLLTVAPDAGGAGITTHRWMAEVAIDEVDIPQLQGILRENLAMVQTGVAFPDVGYVGDNTYGETAHWQRYVDNLLDAIAARDDCEDLADRAGPCAELIAFTFGVAAHGMGDEVFDWLFEPNSPDRDEYFTDVPTANEGGAETQMDLVAIGRYGVERPLAGYVADEALVLQAFVDSGQVGVTSSEFDVVPMLPLLWDVEKGWADEHLVDVEETMPWMSANLITAPGGVEFAATAIAGYWTSMWGHLMGDQPPTEISITYPAPGETDVPATGWDRDSFRPGSDRGRGGARNRIAAALTSARPYEGSTGGSTVSDQLPTDSMTITEVDTGLGVPLKAGYPRSVPYGSDAGEHMIDTQPAGNLSECTWYRVDVSVTAPVLDARGEAVTPYSWQFRTECPFEEPSTTTVSPTTTVAPTSSTNPTTQTPVTTTPGPVTTLAHETTRPASVRSAAAATPVEARPTYTG